MTHYQLETEKINESLVDWKEQLGGGFKQSLFSPLLVPGEMIQFE